MMAHPTHCATHGTLLHMCTVDGLLVATCVKCERKRAHFCIDCGAVRVRPQAHRCPTCSRIRTYAKANARRRRPCLWCGLMIEGTKRQYCCDDHARLEKLRRCRARYAKNPQPQRDRKRAYFRTTEGILTSHRSKRKGRLSGTWGYETREGYLAAMAKQNARPERIAATREWARVHQSVYFKGGKKLYPHCCVCGGRIKWNRIGRPKKRHDHCQPKGKE